MIDYYKEIQDAVIDGDTSKVVKMIKEAANLKFPAESILKEGLIKGINTISMRFKYEDVLIPEVLMSTRSLQTGLRVLKPYLESKDKRNPVKVVLGTVSGDVHDIGKNIVKILISTLNVEIVDLGVDVTCEDFVDAVKEENPDILMMSALLTTTVSEMATVMDELKRKKLRDDISIFIGGGPVRDEFRKEIGADYYFDDAVELRDYMKVNLYKLCKRKTKEKNKRKSK